MKEILLLNPENVSAQEAGSYRVREASRAVVIDENGLVAMLFVSKAGYYKLPGGGFEGKENRTAALARECREEIGCEIEILNELGVVTEYRKEFGLKQISYCYLAKTVGEKKEPQFDAGELKLGFEVMWQSYPEAVSTLDKSDFHSKESAYEGGLYIVPRDKVILDAAAGYLQRQETV